MQNFGSLVGKFPEVVMYTLFENNTSSHESKAEMASSQFCCTSGMLATG